MGIFSKKKPAKKRKATPIGKDGSKYWGQKDVGGKPSAYTKKKAALRTKKKAVAKANKAVKKARRKEAAVGSVVDSLTAASNRQKAKKAGKVARAQANRTTRAKAANARRAARGR